MATEMTQEEKQRAAMERHEERKRKNHEDQQVQTKRRRHILKKILEANHELNQKDKQDAKKSLLRVCQTSMKEVHHIIKEGLEFAQEEARTAGEDDLSTIAGRK